MEAFAEESFAHDLLLLMTNMSQMKDGRRVLSLFQEAMNSLHTGFSILHGEDAPASGKSIDISTANRTYGHFEYHGKLEDVSPVFPALFANSVQILATILEKLHNDKLLMDEKLLLRDEVEATTQSLKLSDDKHRSMIVNISDVIAVIDADGIMQYVSPNIEKLFGWRPEDLLETDVWESVHPGDLGRLKNEFSGLNETKSASKTVEYQYKVKDGSYKWIQLTATNRLNDPAIEGTLLNYHDISERKEAEEALRESEERFRRLAENAPDMIYRMSVPDGCYEYVSPASTEMFGQTPDVFLHSPHLIQEVIHPDWREYFSEQWEALLAGEMPPFYEYQIVHGRSGETRWLHQRNMLIRDDAGLPAAIEGIVTDITERKQTEEALRESELKFRSVIEQSNDAIFILFNDRLDLVNPRFTELTDITIEDAEHPDFNLLDTIGPESRAVFEERERMLERGGQPFEVYDFSLTGKYGELHQVLASITEIDYRDGKAVLGILRDVSERKALENQLRQAQKIESIGQLAGGVAHDFNNLLTPIIGNSELLMMDLDPSEAMYEDLREIHETATRAGDLTRQLLAFSRKQVLNVTMVNLNKLIENFRKILRRTIREDVKIEIKYGSSIGSVRVDVSQIEQILMNLLVNAQDAMPAGGVITVETSSVELDHEYAYGHMGVTPGPFVMLAVSDTGEGMDKETVQKIFEPFFTTKEVGKGTGLGLSTVHGIVKQHGGDIWVYSEPGKGTSIKLYLPEVLEESTKGVDPGRRGKRHHGTGTILVVEDQEQVRRVAARILRTHGYTVHVAGNGEEALSMVRSRKPSIDLLLTDVIMPGMNGREVYERISRFYPDLKVLYMSGYTPDVISHHGVLDEGIDFLQKPLTVDTLTSKVKEVLERGG